MVKQKHQSLNTGYDKEKATTNQPSVGDKINTSHMDYLFHSNQIDNYTTIKRHRYN